MRKRFTAETQKEQKVLGDMRGIAFLCGSAFSAPWR
jgi:hypothetical protein